MKKNTNCGVLNFFSIIFSLLQENNENKKEEALFAEIKLIVEDIERENIHCFLKINTIGQKSDKLLVAMTKNKYHIFTKRVTQSVSLLYDIPLELQALTVSIQLSCCFFTPSIYLERKQTHKKVLDKKDLMELIDKRRGYMQRVEETIQQMVIQNVENPLKQDEHRNEEMETPKKTLHFMDEMRIGDIVNLSPKNNLDTNEADSANANVETATTPMATRAKVVELAYQIELKLLHSHQIETIHITYDNAQQ
ncbi:hypothetical protein RFI_39908, partial [Reticulomyxa filosa]